MATYRFYRLNSEKRITSAAEDYHFDGDLHALQHAKCLVDGHAIGVWDGPRFVANVDSEERLFEQMAGHNGLDAAGFSIEAIVSRKSEPTTMGGWAVVYREGGMPRTVMAVYLTRDQAESALEKFRANAANETEAST